MFPFFLSFFGIKYRDEVLTLPFSSFVLNGWRRV